MLHLHGCKSAVCHVCSRQMPHTQEHNSINFLGTTADGALFVRCSVFNKPLIKTLLRSLVAPTVLVIIQGQTHPCCYSCSYAVDDFGLWVQWQVCVRRLWEYFKQESDGWIDWPMDQLHPLCNPTEVTNGQSPVLNAVRWLRELLHVVHLGGFVYNHAPKSKCSFKALSTRGRVYQYSYTDISKASPASGDAADTSQRVLLLV